MGCLEACTHGRPYILIIFSSEMEHSRGFPKSVHAVCPFQKRLRVPCFARSGSCKPAEVRSRRRSVSLGQVIKR